MRLVFEVLLFLAVLAALAGAAYLLTRNLPKAPESKSREQDRLETLERQVRSLQLEWESTYNKLRAVVARLNKRAEREEAGGAEPDSLEPTRPSSSASVAPAPLLRRRINRGF